MLSKIIHETKTNNNILKILWQRAHRQLACVLQDHCVWTGFTKLPPWCWTWVCLWMSMDPSISLSFHTSNTDSPGAIQGYNITSKTCSHIPLVSSCFMPDWSKYSAFILLLPNWLSSPQDSTKHSQNIYFFDALWFPTNCFPVSLSGTKATLQTIFIWK